MSSPLPHDKSFSLQSAEQWLVRLQALSAALAEAATPQEIAEAILDSAVDAQGATSGTLLRVSDDGTVAEILLSRGLPPGVYEPGPLVPGRPATGLAELARGGAPVLLASLDLTRHPELAQRFPNLPTIVERTGIQAAAILPLRIEERTLGLLALGFSVEHPFGDEERAFMLSLARQSALALERSRLYEAERAARAEAERALAQLRAIESVTDTSLVRLPLDQVVRTLLGRVRRVLGSDTATLLLCSDDRSRLEVHTQLGLEEDVRMNLTVPWGVGFAGSIAATGRPRIIEDVPHSDVYSEWVRTHLQAMLGVPLLVEGGVIGVLHAGSTRPRHFTEADVSLLQRLADRVALVIAYAQRAHAAEEMTARRDSMIHSVVHDLKHPLAGIMAYTQLAERALGRKQPELDQVQRYVGRVRSSSQRMLAMLDELLDVSRLRSGEQLDLALEPTDLAQLARSAVEEQQEVAASHVLNFASDADELIGLWDPRRLERVVTNLLTNAVKFSPAGTTIEVHLSVEARDAERWAVLSVRDQGIGIAGADLPRVFDWFYRGRNAAEQAPGIGIGLAGARQIVEQLGGELTLQSREGAGTTAIVRLPLE